MSDPKTDRIIVRLLPSYRKGLELLAERRGVKLSVLVRSIIEQALQQAIRTGEITIQEITQQEQQQTTEEN